MRRLLKVIVLVAGLQAYAVTDNSISAADTEALLPIAESLIDDFYSFDSVRLEQALARAVDFFVTDTFEIAFEEGRVTSVETSSNDIPIYY